MLDIQAGSTTGNDYGLIGSGSAHRGWPENCLKFTKGRREDYIRFVKSTDSKTPDAGTGGNMLANEALSPYKTSVWQRLTPGERLSRSWAMRSRLPDPRAAHDRKLFPKP